LSLADLNELMRGYDGFPLKNLAEANVVYREVAALHKEWGDGYSVETLYDLNDTGLRTHMRADTLEIGRKFEMGEDGGSGTLKTFRRVGNSFGDDVVDGHIAAKVSNAYDGTRGDTVKIPADQVVRPINHPLDASDNYVAGPIRTPAEVAEGKQRWKDYTAASDAINKRVADYVGSPNYVHYSHYTTDDRDVPQDNLDEVAVEGDVVFIAEGDEFYGEEFGDYESPVLTNPTWLELCRHFNDSIKRTGDQHHIFLEGIYKVKKKDPSDNRYRFATGS